MPNKNPLTTPPWIISTGRRRWPTYDFRSQPVSVITGCCLLSPTNDQRWPGIHCCQKLIMMMSWFMMMIFIMFLLFFIVRHHLKKLYGYMIMTSEQGLIWWVVVSWICPRDVSTLIFRLTNSGISEGFSSSWITFAIVIYYWVVHFKTQHVEDYMGNPNPIMRVILSQSLGLYGESQPYNPNPYIRSYIGSLS